MLEDLKQNTKVAEVDSKDSRDSKAFIVSGTFSQIKAAHETSSDPDKPEWEKEKRGHLL